MRIADTPTRDSGTDLHPLPSAAQKTRVEILLSTGALEVIRQRRAASHPASIPTRTTRPPPCRAPAGSRAASSPAVRARAVARSLFDELGDGSHLGHVETCFC